MMRAPAFSAARASPATTFPGSTTPPGTMRTTFKSPESLQQIGASFAGSERPNSYTPGSSRPESMRNVPRIFWYPASTSPSPGSGPAAVSSSASPPVRPLAPSPSALASSTSTDFLGSSLANHADAESPVKPPPTTAKSTRSGSEPGAGRKSTVQGGTPHGCVLRDMAPLGCGARFLGRNGNKISTRKARFTLPGLAVLSTRAGVARKEHREDRQSADEERKPNRRNPWPRNQEQNIPIGQRQGPAHGGPKRGVISAVPDGESPEENSGSRVHLRSSEKCHT